MAKLPEEGYIISIGTEGYWVSDGFAELLIRLLRDGESSNAVLTTKTAIQNEKMELTNENKRLKEELELVRDDNTMFEEDVKELKNDLEESQRNNIKLAADVKALEVRFDIVSAASIGFRKDIQKLQEENDKLRQDNKEFSDNIKKLRTQCSTSVGQRNKYYELYKQLTVENRRLHRGFAVLDLDNFIKEGVRERCFKLQAENEELKTQSSSLQKENIRLVEELEDLQKKNEYLSELKEQLEASSDLTMTNELADILDEYAGAEQKNHNIFVDKLAKFQDKHKLTHADRELKRG